MKLVAGRLCLRTTQELIHVVRLGVSAISEGLRHLIVLLLRWVWSHVAYTLRIGHCLLQVGPAYLQLWIHSVVERSDFHLFITAFLGPKVRLLGLCESLLVTEVQGTNVVLQLFVAFSEFVSIWSFYEAELLVLL